MKLSKTTSISDFVVESEKILLSKAQLPVTPLQYAARISNQNGEWLEFGTGSGESTKIMSNERMGTNRVYTFDSFLGLPENWGRLDHGIGSFKQVKPKLPRNVVCVEGLFEKTLPNFLKSHPNIQISLIHIDCDVYSSTKTVLTYLAPLIKPGCVIVFDELFFYNGCEKHEALALYEMLQEFGFHYEFIGIRGTLRGDEAMKQTPRHHMLGPDHNILPFDIDIMERVALRILY